jgi:hypothetical protein
MCIFVVLCVDETYYFMREYSDAIKLHKSYHPPPLPLLVGRDCRLRNVWLAKEDHKEKYTSYNVKP